MAPSEMENMKIVRYLEETQSFHQQVESPGEKENYLATGEVGAQKGQIKGPVLSEPKAGWFEFMNDTENAGASFEIHISNFAVQSI